MVPILLQSSPTQDVPLQKIILLLLGILAVVTVGLIVVQRVKKNLQSAEEDDLDQIRGGFTLSDLRRLHKSGEMSNEEFEKAKARVIDAARRAADRDAIAKIDEQPGEPPGAG